MTAAAPRLGAPPRGGQQGYEPPATRMRRDERILDLALERWSERQIAAEVGLTQGGVSKALRRIFTRRLATLTQETEAYRLKLGPSNGTRSSVLGSTRSIPSTSTAGKTICSGASIRPIRSSPWRWPIMPSRRAGNPVTTASRSDGCRPGGRGDLLDEPPRPACVDAPLAQRLGPHQRDAAIITPHRLVAQRASAVRERAMCTR